MKGEYITFHSYHHLLVFEAEYWSSKVSHGPNLAASRDGQEDSERQQREPVPLHCVGAFGEKKIQEQLEAIRGRARGEENREKF